METSGDMMLTLRDAVPEDEELLFRIFLESRPDLFWISGLDEANKLDFLKQQFIFEQQQVGITYPDVERSIIVLGENPIGRIYVQHGETESRIITLGLLPEYRRMGIGSRLINRVIDEGLKKGNKICLQVAWFNQTARALYEKLGFIAVEDKGVFCEMQYSSQGFIST